MLPSCRNPHVVRRWGLYGLTIHALMRQVTNHYLLKGDVMDIKERAREARQLGWMRK